MLKRVVKDKDNNILEDVELEVFNAKNKDSNKKERKNSKDIKKSKDTIKE